MKDGQTSNSEVSIGLKGYKSIMRESEWVTENWSSVLDSKAREAETRSAAALNGGSEARQRNTRIAAKGGLANVAKEVIASGKAKPWKDPVTGMTFEIRPTGWTDANGIHGYISMPGAASVQAARLGSREMATKENREVTK